MPLNLRREQQVGRRATWPYTWSMYPPPAGPGLTAQQHQELDDTFLSSDPFGYFTARIEMILRWAESGNDSHEEPIGAADDEQRAAEASARFARFLGRPARYLLGRSPRSIATQVATDAYALRHHAAESLVRLAATLLARSDVPRLCVWQELATGPNQLDQVVDQLRKPFSSPDAPMLFARLVLREQDLQNGITEELASASNVFADWLQFAVDLLVGHELQLNAAHNKVKHGLSVRARDDLRVSFAASPSNADGTISDGALKGSNVVHIFDRPVIEILAQAPRVNGHRQGLELTQLRVDAPAILAEAYMIAWAHGAIFHVAASRHFGGRPNRPSTCTLPLIQVTP